MVDFPVTAIFRKTLKREVALFGLVIWAIVTLWLFFGVSAVDLSHYQAIYANITWTVWTFTAAAFGAQVFQNVLAEKDDRQS